MISPDGLMVFSLGSRGAHIRHGHARFPVDVLISLADLGLSLVFERCAAFSIGAAILSTVIMQDKPKGGNSISELNVEGSPVATVGP